MAQARAIPATSAVRFNRFLALVYLVMAAGMAITALVSTAVSTNQELMKRILFYPWFTFGLFLLQIVVVVFLGTAVRSVYPRGGILIIFVILRTDRLGDLIDLYLLQSDHHRLYLLGDCRNVLIQQCRRTFYQRRYEQRRQISNARPIGLDVWMDLRALLPTIPGLNHMMNFTGILLFAGLTVWDTNRSKELSTQLEGKQGMGGLVVIGALALYLDFINMFLLLLRSSRR